MMIVFSPGRCQVAGQQPDYSHRIDCDNTDDTLLSPRRAQKIQDLSQRSAMLVRGAVGRCLLSPMSRRSYKPRSLLSAERDVLQQFAASASRYRKSRRLGGASSSVLGTDQCQYGDPKCICLLVLLIMRRFEVSVVSHRASQMSVGIVPCSGGALGLP